MTVYDAYEKHYSDNDIHVLYDFLFDLNNKNVDDILKMDNVKKVVCTRPVQVVQMENIYHDQNSNLAITLHELDSDIPGYEPEFAAITDYDLYFVFQWSSDFNDGKNRPFITKRNLLNDRPIEVFEVIDILKRLQLLDK